MTRCFMMKFTEVLFRSYGQLFLCNSIPSGVLFFIAMTLISPRHGLLSLLGGISIIGVVFRIKKISPLVRSGLFGINGILLGYTWLLFPQIQYEHQLILTLAGSIALACIMLPITTWLYRKKSAIAVFSLPYVLMLWALIWMMGAIHYYDDNMIRGWNRYLLGNYPEAESVFRQISVMPAHAQAHRDDGIGWARFKQYNYQGASIAFLSAVDKAPYWSDPYDGLGWSNFKMNQFDDSRRNFEQAIQHDTMLADSWDGLGWIHYISGDYPAASRCFRNAILSSPFFPDAYSGMSQACKNMGDQRKADLLSKCHGILMKWGRPDVWFIRSNQIAGWILFLGGVFLHSGISGWIVGLGLVLSGLLSQWFDLAGDRVLELNFFYNLAAVLIALGGHYLILTAGALLWIAVISVVLQLSWSPLSSLFDALGLPLVSLPFNLVLIASILIFSFEKIQLPVTVVPLDMAVTNPLTVRIWMVKKTIIQKCWKKISV